MNSARKHALVMGLTMLLSLAGTSHVLALDPQKTISQYGHSYWVRENGLPASNVKAIIQTRDGFIWLGTASGLFRFDGVEFSEVRTNEENPGVHESISALCESSDGSVWVGTQFNGLRCLKNGIVQHYDRKGGFYDTEVSSVFETRGGRLLVSTSIGFFVFDKGKFKPILVNPNYVRSIAEDSSGRIWVGTFEGLKIFDGSDFKLVQTITTADGLQNNLVNFIYTDRESNVWVGTFNGLTRWRNGKVTAYNVNEGLSSYHINSMFEDRNGNLWVGTRGGVNRFSGGRWTNYRSSDGLTDDNVLSFAEDREGSLWVGTDRGLNQFKNPSITTFTKYEGLADNHISGIAETPDGSLFFLSDQGASITCVKGGKVKIYNSPVGPAYVAHDGSLWIGQNGSLLKIKDRKFSRYDSRSGLPQRWISAIDEDKKSIFMYLDHFGIYRFIKGRLEPYLLADGKPYPMPEEYIVCLYQQSDTVLWVGTADSLVKVQNGKITGFTKADGLAGNWISSIYDDHAGSLWIGSPQGGLTRFKNGSFTPFNTKVGLFNDQIYCVVGDNYGGLWLSSPEGIACVGKQELDDYAEGRIGFIHSKVFSTADGMRTGQCFGQWQPAGWKTRDGHIWFATQDGAVMIDPTGFTRNKLPPPVLIETVVADRRLIPADSFLVFSSGTDKLEFHYNGLSFLVPERVLFKYMLVGYDRDWVDAGTRRAAYYTNLPPGTYRFEVIACNNDGVWNEKGASFAFKLSPHFYEQYWFFMLVIAVVGGAAFGTYRLRVWQLLKRERKLGERIQEAMADIKTLSGLIPICSNCKKIRDDKGYWENLEKYIQSHSEAQFSHGICPDCAAKLYPNLVSKLGKKKRDNG